VKVSDMLQALEMVGGAAVRQRVRFERNEQVAGIVANWSRGATAERAHALGLRPDATFNAIIEQYIEDCKTRPGYPTDALKGLTF
jgi:nucleoside-diphosphate-sugar epimerase